MKIRFISFLLLVGFVIVPTTATATDFLVMVDGPSLTNAGFIDGATSGDRLLLTAEKDRSYCCSVYSQDLAAHARFSTSVEDLSSFTLPRSSFNGNRAPVVPTAEEHPASVQTRYCFASGINGPIGLELEFSKSSVNGVKLWCEETTLVGTYNLAASDFAYLEVSSSQSTENSSDTWIRAITNAPGLSIIGEYNLGSGSNRFDQPIHEFVTPGSFGNIYLLHTGPPHSVYSSVAQYEVRSTFPFVFSIVAKSSLQKRTK